MISNLKLKLRAKLAIASFVRFYLFKQLIHCRWPFSRVIEIEEAIEKGLTLSYTEKFSRQSVDSSIRPLYVSQAQTEAYCRLFEERAPTHFPKAGLVELADVLVDMPTGISSCQGWILRHGLLDEICLTNPLYLAAFVTLPWKRPSVMHEGILLGLPFIKNYYHWLLEIMPRIQMIEVEPQFANLPWFLPADCPGFVRNLINAAGYGDRVRYLKKGVYRFNRLIVPTTLSEGSGPNHPHEINWLRKTFLPDLLPQATRRIFVSRRDAKIRFIINEQEVFERLKPLGFELVCPGNLSFSEQVKLFSEAAMIVGPHGAAFTNIVFAPASSGLIEIFGNPHFSDCYSQIAKLRNMPYGFVVGELDGLGIMVDLDQMEETVNQMLAVMDTPLVPQVALSDL